MLNAEKYKEEIKELDYKLALCGNELKECGVVKCSDCEFNKYPGTLCAFGRTKWLLEEYKEPILTSDDKTFLKSLIGSHKEYAVSIEIVYTLRPGYTPESDKNLAIRSVKIKLVLPHKLENETLTWYITWPILNDSLLKNLKFGPVYTIDELELYK